MILQRTPPWVFAVFIVLLAAGIVQSRDRQMSRARALRILQSGAVR